MSVHSNRSPAAVLLALSAAALVMAGCGSSQPRSATAAADAATPPRAATVAIKGYAFKPPTVRVKVAGAVTWRNLDGTAHTATATDNRAFDSGSIGAGGKVRTVTFKRAGTFSYYCAFHPFMHGAVIVTP